MTAVTVLAIGVFWGAVLVFALGLARAAAKPTPRLVRDPLDDVTFDWPTHEEHAS